MENIPNENGFNDIEMNMVKMKNDLTILSWKTDH